ncbi:MAG: Metal dependent phosphohydrolase [Candidatus Magasanikbacteria bacterium GW2011_GWC2_34_16]|uniref:Metal dependent phosphohydrolase n=2 Tax=Candidatus Magasanikiibacteriota TaxID=1752731 RepID=A0A0G0JU70_9BACT|nr:MAG: Metal dependent phosphohydrolase [Candidatus Magasanikbacteria bacterium GW2011_GWC2_34_16]KKQ40504.1 MAG: Metal dependent phosphohydrolase [Candidatus Magasanikbacteria bacterium GW2011_GWA2_37_8]
MSQELVKKTADYVKHHLGIGATGHDWFHIERVWRMAKKLQAKEGGDLENVELIALLHDLGDSQERLEFIKNQSDLILHGMMDILGFEPAKQELIIKAVDEIQYRGTETKTPTTLEAKIVQDADWLDAVGVVGIARTFATGGRIKRVFHDPKRKPRRSLTEDDYLNRKLQGTSFNYFYEKVLRLPKMMNTKTAKITADERIKYLENFLAEFQKEWNGE